MHLETDNMSDYEDYWTKRNEIEGLEDPGEQEQTYPKKLREDLIFKETYTHKGGLIEVSLNEEFAYFGYANGSSAEVPLSQLLFCPSCVKEGKYPFALNGEQCPIHKIEFFNFDIRRFEEFKVLSQLNGYRG